MKQLPSQHETERLTQEKKQIDQDVALQKKAARLRASVDTLLKSEEGRIVWAHLFELCGYNRPSLTRMAGGDIAPFSTECKDAQRLVYLEMRKLATPELLAKAEYQAEFGEAPAPTPQTPSKKGDAKNAST